MNRWGPSKNTLVLSGLLLLGLVVWLAWQQAAHNRPAPRVQAFWERFLATNAAWLEPQPPGLAYETTVQRLEPERSNTAYSWRTNSLLRTWCTPDRNLRFIEQPYPLPTPLPTQWSEHRYFHGRGNRVRLKSEGSSRELPLDLWLAGRTGVGFLTPLHLLAAWGLPPPVQLEASTGGLFRLSIPQMRALPFAWYRDRMVGSAYGLHPVVFASQAELRPGQFEVLIDAASLRPTALVERDAAGKLEAKTTFDSWLELQGHPVPGKLRCELPGRKEELHFEFTVAPGAWLLKELVQTNANSYSLCHRSVVQNVQPGPIPDRVFPAPADLELPAHALSTFGPGERRVEVRTRDGLVLEGKLSLPAAAGPVPVVFFLPGAGPWSFDRPLLVPDLNRTNTGWPAVKTVNYYDFFAQQLAARGIGLFRCHKRGCSIVADEQGHPTEIANRRLFAKATPSVLLADYQAALKTLRGQPGVDPDRVVLLGASEGTRLAPRLALLEPAGLAAVVLFGYSEHGTRDTILWQRTEGPWRNVAKIFDANDDVQITRAEYEEAVQRVGKELAAALPFGDLDRNGDGVVTPKDLDQRPAAEAIFKAVRARDDDFLWDHLANLSSAYALEEWEAPPTHRTLLQLNLPVAIFHGESDGTCRVEGAREAQVAFQKAGRTNLTLKLYPKTDHDLNWARFLRDGQVPPAFNDLFNDIAGQLQAARMASLPPGPRHSP